MVPLGEDHVLEPDQDTAVISGTVAMGGHGLVADVAVVVAVFVDALAELLAADVAVSKTCLFTVFALVLREILPFSSSFSL